MSLKLYGLKNCDTCRKALKALSAAGLEHDFIDVRADGVSEAQIAAWAKSIDWTKLLNTKSTTWRGLSDHEKQDLGPEKAIALMTAHPTLIKRPVIEAEGSVQIGWTDTVREAIGA